MTNPDKNRVLLGDRTERMLASIGITKEYYAEIREKFGLAPGCRCRSRQQYLNRIDKWFKEKMAK